jgi:hypothetical protein
MAPDTRSTPAAAHTGLLPAVAVVTIGVVGFLASSRWPFFGTSLGATLDDWFAAPYGPDGAHAVRELAASIFALVASVGLGWGIVTLLRRDPAGLHREIDRPKLLAGTVRGMALLLLISLGAAIGGWVGTPGGGLAERWASEKGQLSGVGILAVLTLACALVLVRQIRRDRAAREARGRSGSDNDSAKPSGNLSAKW